jgi:hypothetical protein
MNLLQVPHLHNLDNFLLTSFFFCEVVDPIALFLECLHLMHDDIIYHLRLTFNMPNL